MQRDNTPFEPGEQELPEGWEPERDNDPIWQGIVAAAREADRPSPLKPAQKEALRLATRRQLLEEGLIEVRKASASNDQSFGAWLRSLFFGGGMGGQFVRLGAAAAFAFWAGSALNISAPESSMPLRTETAQSEQAPSPGNTVAAATETPATPQAVPRTVSTTINKSAVEDQNGWTSTAPSTQVWEFDRGGGATAVPVGISTGSASPPAGLTSRDQLGTQALESLQVLRFSSLVNQEESNLAHIRRIEQILTQLMAESAQQKQEPAMQSAGALENFRQAEYALSARRYNEALQGFEQAASMAPGTVLAFLSHFQAGRIAYDRTQDYELALDSFREALDLYPGQELPIEYRDFLETRVEILSSGMADNWRSLRAWHAADQAQIPQEAVANLKEVVRAAPSVSLAADAADRLENLVVADATKRQIDHQQVVNALSQRVSRELPSPQAARIQFAIAEIYARRSQNLGQALIEYRRALNMSPDDQTRRKIEIRLHAIMNMRLTGLPAQE